MEKIRPGRRRRVGARKALKGAAEREIRRAPEKDIRH